MKRSLIVGLVLGLALLGACGDNKDSDTPSTTTKPTTTSTTAEATSTTKAGLEQPAIWPDADTYFATPEAAARDFVSKVLDVPPSLGAFQAGDSRSGEMVVYSPGEGGSTKVPRSTLLLRQLGPKSGWFILAAVNDNASITAPTSGTTVSPGKVTVKGKARGFEANVVVRAFIVGDDVEVAKVVTQGGAMETPEPYSVSLDLSSVPSGSTVMLLVRGGVGLETDPGEFGALPILVS
jgi:hypothetical protein